MASSIGAEAMRLSGLSASEARRLIGRGELTAEALVRACLERIAVREPVVGAWQHLDPEAAIAAARACDRQPNRGPLHGLPIGVKDIFDTADMPTTYGSPIYARHRPREDAWAVRKAREAGAIFLGKTVTTEFAYFSPGKTTNPHDPAHTPGGSSSGSAAAVADKMIPLAVGTQTAGSVIRPAAFCGVVGFKGSHGLVSMAGVKPFAPSLDTLGVFARSVEDADLFVRVLFGEDMKAPELVSVRPRRIGLCRTEHWPKAEPVTVATLGDVAERLRLAGAEVEELELPEPFHGLAEAQLTIMGFEARLSYAAEWRDHANQLSDKLRELLEAARGITEARYEEALRQAAAARTAFESIFHAFDVLLTPSAVGEAPHGIAATGDPLFNRVWTLLHVPCITLPAAVGPHGLPIGVQLVGRFKEDHALLAAARWVEAELT